MEIIIARHGKTNENKAGNLAGNSNTAQLVEEGKKHAETLARLFLESGIEKIISSPLDRAVDTAKPIAKALNLEIQKEDLLREFDFGDLDGREEKGEALKGLKKRRYDLDYKFPNGESYNGVLKRAKKFLSKLLKKKKKLNAVLLVAHGGTNRCLLSSLLKQNLAKEPEKLDKIDCANNIVYIFDTRDNSIKWVDTKENKSGRGILLRNSV